MADNKEIQRWDDAWDEGGYIGMCKDDAGGWVEYSDHIAALSRIRAETAKNSGEDEIIAALLANEPFVFDPATHFVHADDGGAPEHGIKYVPAEQNSGEVVDRENGHVWHEKVFSSMKLKCCMNCGFIYNEDQPNKPCPGPIGVEPRSATPANSRAEAIGAREAGIRAALAAVWEVEASRPRPDDEYKLGYTNAVIDCSRAIRALLQQEGE